MGAVALVALFGLSLLGCSSDEGDSSEGKVKVEQVPAKVEADLRAAAGDRADDVRSLELRDGVLVVETIYPAGAKSAAQALSMCTTALDSGWAAEVQVIAEDQSGLASSDDGTCTSEV